MRNSDDEDDKPRPYQNNFVSVVCVIDDLQVFEYLSIICHTYSLKYHLSVYTNMLRYTKSDVVSYLGPWYMRSQKISSRLISKKGLAAVLYLLVHGKYCPKVPKFTHLFNTYNTTGDLPHSRNINFSL